MRLVVETMFQVSFCLVPQAQEAGHWGILNMKKIINYMKDIDLCIVLLVLDELSSIPTMHQALALAGRLCDEEGWHPLPQPNSGRY